MSDKDLKNVTHIPVTFMMEIPPNPLRDKLIAEGAITLGQAAKLPQVANPRGGKRFASTLFRWVREGIRGVKLEAFFLPGGWRTSEAAINRFLDRIEAVKRGEYDERDRQLACRAGGPAPATRASRAAERELDRLGIA